MKKTLLIIGAILLIVAVGASYVVYSQKKLAQTDISTLKTYTNSVYGYRFLYPQNAKVDYIAAYETIPVEQSDEAIVSMTGKPAPESEFWVNAYIALPKERALEAVKKQNDLITLPLKQFAETMRQNQINDRNPYAPDKQTGELVQTTFAGRKAFSFTQTRGFNDGFGGSYSLDFRNDNPVHNFVFVESSSGVKLMLHYPLNDSIAEQIKDSFKFTVK